jgi:pyruvate ferredoxin oxidoreductase alpha subunit
MNAEMMTGNLAAAWGARLAEVDYVPAFPITPQTEIVEMLSKWCGNGSLNARFVTLDSEHSMMTAAGAAAATGARVFTATSSQGLLHAFEVLYTVAGWRVPFVLVNVSRALASPSPWNRTTTMCWRRAIRVSCRSMQRPARKSWTRF